MRIESNFSSQIVNITIPIEQVPVIQDMDTLQSLLSQIQQEGNDPSVNQLQQLCIDLQKLSNDCTTLAKSPDLDDELMAKNCVGLFESSYAGSSLMQAAFEFSPSDPIPSVDAIRNVFDALKQAGGSLNSLIGYLTNFKTEYPLPGSIK